MTASTAQTLRIANLVPPAGGAGFGVPDAVVGAGFTSEVFPLSSDIMFVNEFDRTVSGLMYTDAGLRAQAAGYDAVFINNFGDYGIRGLRAAAAIPVVGAGQAALQLAAGLADRFGILTVWPRVTATSYRRLLAEYGVERQCVGVRHVAANEELPQMWNEGGLVNDLRSLREAALERMAKGGRDLLEQGAEAIVLGCTCMSPATAELQERLGCPVIDGLTAAHKTAELLVTLGLSHATVPVPASLTGLLPGLFGEATSQSVVEEELCGDTCAVIGAPESSFA